MAESQNTEPQVKTVDPTPATPAAAPTDVPAQAPEKMSPAAFEKALAEGKISTKGISNPEDLINSMVDFGDSNASKPAEQPQPKPDEKSVAAEQAPKPDQKEKKDDRPWYDHISELLKAAKTATGEEFKDAHSIIEKYRALKEDVKKREGGLSQWQKDAMAARAEKERLELEKTRLQEDYEKLKKRLDVAASPPKPQEAPPQQITDEDEPEVERPEAADSPEEWAKYAERVTKRNERITKKKLAQIGKTVKDQMAAQEARHKQELAALQARAKEEAELQRRADEAARYKSTVIDFAEAFIQKHKEFAYEDGLSVQEKTAEYEEWLGKLDYIKRQNPSLQNRNLANEYLSGNPDTIAILDRYAVRAPEGAKQYALLVELESIAKRHNLQKDGRPDFDEALALKKRRDGVDVDEQREAHARGVESALNAVQERNGAPPTLSAAEAQVQAQTQTKQITAQQVDTMMNEYQRDLPSLTPEQKSERWKAIEKALEVVGVQVMPGTPI